MKELRSFTKVLLRSLAICVALSLSISLSAEATELAAQESNTQWTRLEGENRYETTKDISQTGYSQANKAIIATGKNYPDALAASALAGVNDCPILLTDPNTASQQMLDEVQRLGVQSVYLVGGEGAISSSVANTIAGIIGSSNVIRISGTTRYETAEAIYREGIDHWGDTAILTTALGYADALSVSPYAYAINAPVFLCNPQGSFISNLANTTGSQSVTVRVEVSEETMSTLTSGNFSRIIIVGGESAVPCELAEYIQSKAEIKGYSLILDRWSGDNRYQTSLAIAQNAVAEGILSYNNMAIATGKNYPDALAGGAFCGKKRSVLLLGDESDSGRLGMDCLFDQDVLGTACVSNGYILGGTSAISTWLADYLSNGCVSQFTAEQNSVHELTNQKRADNGISPLRIDKDLCDIAMIRAQELAVSYSHERPYGGYVWDIVRTDYPGTYATVGENCNKGDVIGMNATIAMESWMGSISGHRENLLDPEYDRLGVGYYNDGEWSYWVQVFLG